jgi:hypothetical protein
VLRRVKHLPQFSSQDVHFQFWNVIEKELMHPKVWHRRYIAPYHTCLVEKKEVPRYAVPTLVSGKLQHLVISLRYDEVMIPKVPGARICR